MARVCWRTLRSRSRLTTFIALRFAPVPTEGSAARIRSKPRPTSLRKLPATPLPTCTSSARRDESEVRRIVNLLRRIVSYIGFSELNWANFKRGTKADLAEDTRMRCTADRREGFTLVELL